MIRLRRARAVLRKFDSRQEYWDGAYIVVSRDTILLETYWHNPELCGVWLYIYLVEPKCFASMLEDDLVEEVCIAENRDVLYRLSPRGLERLEKMGPTEDS